MIVELIGNKLVIENIRIWLLRFNINLSISHMSMIFDLIIIVFIIFCLCKSINKMSLFFKKLFVLNKRWQKKYLNENLGNIFLEYKIDRSKNKYINTRIQSDAPSIYDEPQMSNANIISNDFINHFLNRIFINNNQERLYCILADSGMGKTTALVNLFISYIEKYKESTIPYNIKLLTLTDNNVIDNIKKISKPDSTILLLDALDENIEAVVDHKIFLLKLEEACKDFRFVVLSCRTQFFPSDEEQIKESKILIDGSKKGYASYNTFYLSPFNDDEILIYIDRVFGKCKLPFISADRKKLREKADSIVANPGCKNLLVRPMILSHIRQLAEDNDREYNMAIDIYDAMVDFWIEREVGRIDKTIRDERTKQLRTISAELAQNIYDNRISRNGYFIDNMSIEDFLKNKHIDNSILQLRQRSLLNRDAEGLIKFSHKSFLEYFLAKNYFDDITTLNDFSGIDFCKVLYDELCYKYFISNSENDENNIILDESTNNLFNKKQSKYKVIEVAEFNQQMIFLTIFFNKIQSFNLRYLSFFKAEKIIISSSVNLNVFNVKYDWMSNIIAIELNLRNHLNFSFIKQFDNLQYLFLNGNIGMKNEKLSKSILKIFPKITLKLNNQTLLLNGEEYHTDLLSEKNHQYNKMIEYKFRSKVIIHKSDFIDITYK